MNKVKVTVINRVNMQDIFGNKLPTKIDEAMIKPQCDQFQDGQEFILDLSCPANFCGWAFADIQRDITHILMGGDYP